MTFSFGSVLGHPLFQVALLGYGVGSVPWGPLLTRLFLGVDLRKVGSGNTGATNVLRTGSKVLGAWTLVLDALKGAVPVLLVRCALFPPVESGGSIADTAGWLPFWAGSWAVVGHIFPVWLLFRGGKGVASFFGALLACDLWTGCAVVALWLGTVRATHISSAGAVVAVLCAPLVAFFATHNPDFVIFAFGVGALVLGRHGANIRRLWHGKEPRIGDHA